MAASNVVIVESPAKAKTINKYLGPNYAVVASYGHIRDLPARDRSVRPEEDFAMDWEISDRAKKQLDEIFKAVRQANRVYLATDPDREGEAISWHVQNVLQERKLLRDVDVQRVTFNEITKNAVLAAFEHGRPVNNELVEAYLARRALDYLVGFNLSPVLWRKLPGSRSAGRVQSVALRLICERESEIEDFRPQEYWTIDVVLKTADGASFTARLSQLDGKKLDKFALKTRAEAEAAAARLRAAEFHVAGIERRQVRRNPFPPFITSTLQQEASRKLGFSATKTMRTAQRLYEGVDIGGETIGLITYMRTDGVTLSQEAIAGCRSLIGQSYGDRYLPEKPRIYKSNVKNAQEAHEAIRPTDLFRRPEDVSRYLENDEARLYELIWRRTIAAEMESAVFDQVSVDLASERGDAVLRATGSIQLFDGFLRVYQESRDDPADDEEGDRRLPALKDGDRLTRGDVRADQHFTQPPPRYTEASLVKRMEELGIGRPSTYASIMQVLQDREYVKLEKRRFQPEDRGRLVTAFLANFFERYVEYSFTADLEAKLDDVSGGRIDWKQLLREFWQAFSAALAETKDLSIGQVISALDEELGPHFFPSDGSGKDPRACPVCGNGRLSLKLGRHGAFIGCSNYPGCKFTRPLIVANQDAEPDAETGPRELGVDPETKLPVSVRRGPYGAYVQLGPAPDADEKSKDKPKRVSLPKGLSAGEIQLDAALRLLALPREIGRHPESGEMITAGIGRFGPYIKHGPTYKSLTADDDVLTIGMNRAVDLLASAGKGGGAGVLRELGEHPKDQKPVTINKGRFGPYVKHGKVMASLPKAMSAEDITMEQAVELLNAKAGKSPASAGRKAPAKASAKERTKSGSAAKTSTKSKTGVAKPRKPAKRAAGE